MNLLTNKPYKLIWLTIPFILGITIVGSTNTLYMQLFDTTLIIFLMQVGILSSITLIFSGMLYWFVRNRELTKWMTKTHVLSMIFSFLILHISSFILINIDEVNSEIFRMVGQIQIGLILIIIASQTIFILNLLISLIKKSAPET